MGPACAVAGANSTTRNTVPLSDGGTPIVVCAWSAAVAASTGNSRVTHNRVTPFAPRGCGDKAPSNSTTALACESWPVTIRGVDLSCIADFLPLNLLAVAVGAGQSCRSCQA